MNLYRSICWAKVTYGAEVWGWGEIKGLQLEENRYLRKVLKVPPSTPAYIVHEELGVPYLEDMIRLKPVLAWLKVWYNPEAALGRLIINDCLSRDNGMKIAWLQYVGVTLRSIGLESLFTNPGGIKAQDKVLQAGCRTEGRGGNGQEYCS